ncbi:PadR family transcriptional regulator [Microbacterium sp. MEJ108Y]|uniref:PadR family transcriptional regulator n=1 Tax=Microbacterium sp. MEJ108Y TaxID=1587523 RepID=UPI0005AC803C|nr:PadR family transcriptional regulator [Microbacterium sp. MEJ108Y]KIP90322.1 PadR family transcriptional regulator [Microbacterium sp. MEJ108Y]
MGKQMTEMLKGTLEGIVLALLAEQPAYGYEITTRVRDHGFTDIAEGTIYALLVRVEQKKLVDVEKVPSEKGPPRKVYSLNPAGTQELEEFWKTWSFLTQRIDSLRTAVANTEDTHSDTNTDTTNKEN